MHRPGASYCFCFYFHPCSPSICHSDSDLSEGSRKYSPSSETSVETQRACGKGGIAVLTGIFQCTHTHRGASTLAGRLERKWRTSQMLSQMSVTHIKEWLFGQIRLLFPLWMRQLFVLSEIQFLSPVFLSQEDSRKPTPLCVTIMASAARRKCSG